MTRDVKKAEILDASHLSPAGVGLILDSVPERSRVAVGKDPRGLNSVGARGFEPPTFCSQIRGTRSRPMATDCKH